MYVCEREKTRWERRDGRQRGGQRKERGGSADKNEEREGTVARKGSRDIGSVTMILSSHIKHHHVTCDE